MGPYHVAIGAVQGQQLVLLPQFVVLRSDLLVPLVKLLHDHLEKGLLGQISRVFLLFLLPGAEHPLLTSSLRREDYLVGALFLDRAVPLVLGAGLQVVVLLQWLPVWALKVNCLLVNLGHR